MLRRVLRRLGPAVILAVAASPAAAYVVGPVPDAGTVAGRVRFAGAPVTAEPLVVRKNIDVCGPAKPSEALVLSPDGGLANVVVYLEGVERGKAPADLELDNADCVFVPHVAAIALGAKVRVRNSDPILHNTHGFLGRATVFNIALPLKDNVVEIGSRFKKVGAVEVQCDAHTHMRAWIVVRDNPYFAVTGRTGRFEIREVPPGRYRLVAWHPGWAITGRDKDGRPVYDGPRVVAAEVTVPARGEATIELELR